MNVRVLDSLDGPDAIGLPLLACAPFFRSLAWYRSLQAGMPSAVPEPCVLVVEDAAGTALAALCGGWSDGRFVGFTTVYSIEFGISGTQCVEVAEAIAEWLRRCSPRIPAIELRYVDPAEPFFVHLGAALGARGFLVTGFPLYENWYLPCAGLSFDDYWAERPSQLRRTERRRRRKAEGPGGGYRIEIAATAESLDENAFEDWKRVYALSWKRPEPYPRMMPAMLRAARAAGALRLGRVWMDDRCVAAQMWITSAGRATIYKLAYDEAFREYSPGTLLSFAMFRHALDEEQVHEIDYGVGSEPYKRDWMTHVRSRGGMLGWNLRSPRGIAGAGVDRLRGGAKRVVTWARSTRTVAAADAAADRSNMDSAGQGRMPD